MLNIRVGRLGGGIILKDTEVALVGPIHKSKTVKKLKV